jgi:Rad3-related DNA helicase
LQNVILDEAHNLEDVITNSLKKGFSINDLEKVFIIVDNILKKHKFSIDSLSIKKDKILFNIYALFDLFNSYLILKDSSDSAYKNILLKEDFFENNIDNVDIKNLYLSIKSDFLILIDLLKLTPDEVYLELNKDIKFLENILEILEV